MKRKVTNVLRRGSRVPGCWLARAYRVLLLLPPLTHALERSGASARRTRSLAATFSIKCAD
eukprot:360939-Prymnesium_polylepis.1